MNTKNIFNNFQKGIIFGLGFIFIISIAGISYATFNSIQSVNPGNTLTSTKWNEIITRLNSIEQQQLATARVNFDGTSCTLGAGNECAIRDSYNINKIVRTGLGQYDVYFTNTMNNVNYVTNIFSSQTATDMIPGRINKYLNYFHFLEVDHTGGTNDAYDISISVFGGK